MLIFLAGMIVGAIGLAVISAVIVGGRADER